MCRSPLENVTQEFLLASPAEPSMSCSSFWMFLRWEASCRNRNLISDKIKVRVVSILLYGYTSWTLTKCLEKKLDVNNAIMLRAVLYKSSKQYHTKHLFVDFSKAFDSIHRDTFLPSLFIICLDYVLQISINLMKENGFTLKNKQAKSRRYPAETITNTDWADNLALLENINAQVGYWQQSFEPAARDIGVFLNPDKIEFMCFNPGM